jgi:hypothetical protein
MTRRPSRHSIRIADGRLARRDYRPPRLRSNRCLRVDRGGAPAIFRRLRDASLSRAERPKCPCGGTGRRARLKIEFRKECWFDSGQGHHRLFRNKPHSRAKLVASASFEPCDKNAPSKVRTTQSGTNFLRVATRRNGLNEIARLAVCHARLSHDRKHSEEGIALAR